MAEGPAAGLLLLDDLADHPALQGLHLLPAARADLLARAGRTDEARGRGRARHRAGARPSRSAVNWVCGATGSAEPRRPGLPCKPGQRGGRPALGGIIMSNRIVRVAAARSRSSSAGTIATSQLRQRRTDPEAPRARRPPRVAVAIIQAVPEADGHRHGRRRAGPGIPRRATVRDPLPLAAGSHEVTFGDGVQRDHRHRRRHRRGVQRRRGAPARRGRWHAGGQRLPDAERPDRPRQGQGAARAHRDHRTGRRGRRRPDRLHQHRQRRVRPGRRGRGRARGLAAACRRHRERRSSDRST